MSNTKPTSCLDPFEADAISVADARKTIFKQITPIKSSVKVALRDALNQYLAEDLISPINVPPHTNAAMDGYALAGSDLPTEHTQKYQVVGASFAGVPSDENYQQGNVIRIMTGGVMPNGTDTVVPQEVINNLEDGSIKIDSKQRIGQNVRHPGEDIPKGATVLKNGHQINAADLGIIASLGKSEVKIYRRPRVAFFSTGDELKSIGETLNEGDIYDSNRYTLFALLKNLDVEIIDLGVIRDTKEDIESAFISAAELADIVITSGGVSVGEADFIKPTLKKLGDTHFWKIAMKPGRPLTFGSYHGSWFFGLPGNPVAVMVTFMQFVQPAINYLASGSIKSDLIIKASSQQAIKKRPGRTEYIRAIVEQTEDGELKVKLTGKQGSGILMSMSLANCFIHLPTESAGVESGELVEIVPFKSIT
ncbi:MAG: molybdopterin molybdotransferase [Cocleimonas sp.]|jgi:molybdopterin molybdotransferase